ncbi:hypothetical protein C2W62_37245, partial [Candidatus Entotheonella serta]
MTQHFETAVDQPFRRETRAFSRQAIDDRSHPWELDVAHLVSGKVDAFDQRAAVDPLLAGVPALDRGRVGEVLSHISHFRRLGLGSFRDILLEISRDPAMVFYLDNCMSHKDAINENYGRELLELFSMVVGMDGHSNYTEDDVKACARAFTGWTITNAVPRYPYGRYASHFIFNPADHDDGEKTFLGETGRFNGED